MKSQMRKCSRRWLQWRRRLICVSAALSFFVLSAHAEDVTRPPMGGGGGSPFVARCPQGQHLTGFRLRVGDDVDAIQPLCVTYTVTVETEKYVVWGLPAEREISRKYAAGPLVPYPSKFGGTGGHDLDLLCPSDNPIVTGMHIEIEGRHTQTINTILLFCGGPTYRIGGVSAFPAAQFKAPELFDIAGRHVGFAKDQQHCPGEVKQPYVEGTQIYDHREQRFVKGSLGYQPDPKPGLVAVGINGRSGKWLDAVSLICGELTVTNTVRADPPPAPVKAQGRVKLDPTETAPNPPRAICDLAREARARNSPAAPGLELIFSHISRLETAN